MRKQILVIIALLLFSAVGVNAYEISVNDYSSSVIQKGGHSGESALRLQGTIGGNTYNLTLGIKKGDTLSFWAKGVQHYNQSISLETGSWISPYNAGSDSCLVVLSEEGENGWNKYTTKPEVFAEKGSNTIKFIAEPTPNNKVERWFVDDIVVTDSNGNVRCEVGFEKLEVTSNEVSYSYGSVNADITVALFEQPLMMYPYSFDVFTALYDSEGNLRGIRATNRTVEGGTVDTLENYKINHDFMLNADSNGYSVKTMIWSGGMLVPVSEVKGIENLSTDDAEMIFDVRKWAAEIDTLISECESQGISTDYEKVSWSVLDRYANDYAFRYGVGNIEPAESGYLKKDLEAGNTERAEWNYQLLEDIYLETKTKLNNYLLGNEEPLLVPKYHEGPTKTEGKIVYTKTNTDGEIEERPFFFTGFGHFQSAASDVSNMPRFGYNIIQQSLDPLNFIEYGGSDETPFVAVDNKYVENLRQTFRDAEESNVKTDLLLSLHNYPSWILDKWQDWKMADLETGDKVWVLEHPMNKKLTEVYVKFIMEEFGDYKSLNSICLANEPTTNTNVSFYTDAWAEHLQGIYGTIEKLNSAYSSDYSDFKSVPMCKKDYGSWRIRYYDYKLFNDKVLTQYLTSIRDEVRKYNEDIPVHIKMMSINPYYDWNHGGLLGYGTQHEFLADISDYNGNDASAYIHGKDFKITEMEFFMDTQTSIKKAPCFNSEDHIIHDWNTP